MLLGKKIIGTVGYLGGVPAILEKFMWSWTQMIQYNNDYLVSPNEQIFYTRATVSYHSYARNNLSDAVQGDWILMLDADHEFEPDVVARMLHYFDKDNLDVLVGLYHYTLPPYLPKIYRFNKKMTNVEQIAKWDDIGGNYLIPIEAAGAGCLLVRKRVLRQMEKQFKCKPFDIKPPFSEDLSFFYRLKKMGIGVYCAPMIEFPHLQIKTIKLKDFDNNDLPIGKKVDVS